jgi:hypothetical protein
MIAGICRALGRKGASVWQIMVVQRREPLLW